MQFGKFVNETGTKVSYSIFEGKEIKEYNLAITAFPGNSFTDQLVNIQQALTVFLESNKLLRKNILFQRIFSSDISNQEEELKSIAFCPAVSTIQQPPVGNARISTWMIILQPKNKKSVNLKSTKNQVVFSHNGYSHGFLSSISGPRIADSYTQTKAILTKYTSWLKRNQLTLLDNCIRTWIFVRDIDNNYSGMVKARNEIFTKEKLTSDSHFIASTGIEGQSAISSDLVMIDAYSVAGLNNSQIKYLNALEYLNHTHEYGVAFERGTSIDYGDRRHIFISGTASIDCKGEILYPNDIEKQTRRGFDNIKALLSEAESNMGDVNSMIVYLRDRADAFFVESYLSENYADIPTIVVLAAVCRSGWLIEIECTAIKTVENPEFANF